MHRSTIHISLLVWNTAISFFHYGYYLVYLGFNLFHLGAIPIQTILNAYVVDANKEVAQGILNGCIPVGALIGAAGSSFIIRRFSRRYTVIYKETIFY
jgi:nitrate reductase gamma subunit